MRILKGNGFFSNEILSLISNIHLMYSKYTSSDLLGWSEGRNVETEMSGRNLPGEQNTLMLSFEKFVLEYICIHICPFDCFMIIYFTLSLGFHFVLLLKELSI